MSPVPCRRYTLFPPSCVAISTTMALTRSCPQRCTPAGVCQPRHPARYTSRSAIYCTASRLMQGPNSTLLLVGIKQEEEEFSNTKAVLERHKLERGRLYAEQDASGSSKRDCVNSGNEWKFYPATSPSIADVNHERLTPTISASVATEDLNAATCLSIPFKATDPTSLLEANTSGMQFFKVEEPTGEEPTNHLEVHRSLRTCEHTCEFCGKAFATKTLLNRHVNGVHKDLRNFTCNICGRSFKEKGTLNTHVNIVHKQLRNYSCDICGHSFGKNADVDRHMNAVHKNLRNFTCNICGHSFKEKGTLNTHINNVHKRLRNYSCDICGHSFGTNDHVNRHINAVHKNLRNFPCDICGHSFNQKGSLTKHINTVHKKPRAFLCGICGQQFVRIKYLMRHFDRLHPGEK